MISLEQVNLLETKVAKAIEYVEHLTEKNADLRAKLESSRKRNDELESLVLHFKEEQSRIEGGILSALELLNRFEDAIEKSLDGKQGLKPRPAPVVQPDVKVPPKTTPAAADSRPSPANGEIFFEIPEADSAEDDAVDPLEELSLDEDNKPPANGELDIY
ncbi:MAG: cell division protein ZapB [Treponema sp.]|jgi:FtsZ-binding cell division protein ZapB|nr:cell division protein ZapB [Treponema sp.]